MYRKMLKIGMFGIDMTTASTLARLTTLPNPDAQFEYTLVERDTLDPEEFYTCDLIVMHASCLVDDNSAFDAQTFVQLETIRRERRLNQPGAIALVATQTIVKTLTEEVLDLVDAIWRDPVSPMRTTFELKRLLKSVRCQVELHRMQGYMDTLVDAMPDLVWMKNTDGVHLKVNNAFCAACGKTKAEIAGKKADFIWDEEPPETLEGTSICPDSDQQTIAAKTVCSFDELIRTQRGERQYKVYKAPLFEGDEPVGTIGIAHDVTDFGNITAELDILLNALPFSVVVEDADGRIVNVNHTTETFFGVPREAFIGHTIDECRHHIFDEEQVQQRRLREEDEFEATVQGVHKILELTKAPVVDVFGNKAGCVRIYRDVTSERELEQRIERAARTDYLTGLYNRRHFYELLEKCGERIVLIALDLDDLKDTNDRFGHAAGDEALITMARLLIETFPDGTVIRWGGDEFGVALVGDIALDAVIAKVEHLLARLPLEAASLGTPWSLAGSAGIAVDETSKLSLDELIRRSDEALYQAKRSGKGRVCVYEQHDE